MATALGITLGTRYLRAASPDGPCIRHTSVITLDGASPTMRTPESGTSAENPRVGAGGMTLGGFIERVGDPVPLTAADGSSHLAEDLTVSAIKSLARAVATEFTTPPAIVVGVPAWWAPHQFAALTGALSESSLADARLEPDLACALTELRRLPDFPSDGLVAVVDAGASGTCVGIIDGGRLVTDPLRVEEHSGNDIDYALMRHVLSQVTDNSVALTSPDPNLTAALGVLRRRCSQAKEELSATTAVDVDVDLPGYRGDVRITRNELDDVLAPTLERCASTVREALERGGRSVTELSGLAAIGGGAAISALTQHLSGEFHLPVLVDADPATTAVRGAARRAAQLTDARAVPTAAPVPAPASAPVPDLRRPAPVAATREFPVPPEPRPVLSFTDKQPATDRSDGSKRHRRALIVAGLAAALALLVGGTAAALSRDEEPAAPTVSTPESTTPPSTASTTTAPKEQEIEEQPQVIVPVVPEQPAVTESWTPDPPSTPAAPDTPEVSTDPGSGGSDSGTDGADGSGGTGGSGSDSGSSGGDSGASDAGGSPDGTAG